MSIPNDLRYTKSHEWVKLGNDGIATVGITQHAQELLGDMVFVETPVVGRKLKQGEECAVVESVKAASDVYAPVAGTVTAINDEVAKAPENVNTDAYGAWLFRLQPEQATAIDALLDARGYQSVIAED